MEQIIQMHIEGDRVILKAPSSALLAEFLRDMPYEWDQLRGTFTFPVAFAPAVEALALSFFGTAGEAEMATVQLDASQYAGHHSLEFAGRPIFHRRSPARRPILGPGVYKIAGSWSWEGLGPYPGKPLLGRNDAVLQFMVPATIAQNPLPGMAIVPTVDRISALWHESQRLEARLAVIRKQLNA